MHVVNNMPPYSSSVNAISKFPETATALGVTLDELNNVILTAPCGIERCPFFTSETNSSFS